MEEWQVTRRDKNRDLILLIVRDPKRIDKRQQKPWNPVEKTMYLILIVAIEHPQEKMLVIQKENKIKF